MNPFNKALLIVKHSVRIIEKPATHFNDIVRDRVVHLTAEVIEQMKEKITFGLYKIFEGEMIVGYGEEWADVLR